MTRQLKAVQTQPLNHAINERLALATQLARRLTGEGITVLAVELGRRLPTLIINRPPRRPGIVETEMVINTPAGRRELKTARYQGCLLQWQR